MQIDQVNTKCAVYKCMQHVIKKWQAQFSEDNLLLLHFLQIILAQTKSM